MLEKQISEIAESIEEVDARLAAHSKFEVVQKDLPDGSAACLTVDQVCRLPHLTAERTISALWCTPLQTLTLLAVAQGDCLLIKNTTGHQIASLWACRANPPHEGLSMAKSRAALGRIHFTEGARRHPAGFGFRGSTFSTFLDLATEETPPRCLAGDEFVTTRKQPLLRFEKNSKGGLHDASLPASPMAEAPQPFFFLTHCPVRTCNVGGGMGVQAAMRDALRKRGVKVPANLAPWNLFLFVVRPSVYPRRCLSSAR